MVSYAEQDSEDALESGETSEDCHGTEAFFTSEEAHTEHIEMPRSESGGFDACDSLGDDSIRVCSQEDDNDYQCVRSVGVQGVVGHDAGDGEAEEEGSPAVSSTVPVMLVSPSQGGAEVPMVSPSGWSSSFMTPPIGTEQEGHISSSTEAANDSGCSALDLSHILQQQDCSAGDAETDNVRQFQQQDGPVGGVDSGVESSQEPSRALLCCAEEMEAGVDIPKLKAKRDPKRRRRELLFLMQDEFRDDTDGEELRTY